MMNSCIVFSGEDVATNDVLNLLIRGSHLLAATENDFVCWHCGDIPDSVASGFNATASTTKKAPKSARQRKPLFQAELPYMATEYRLVSHLSLGFTSIVRL